MDNLCSSLIYEIIKHLKGKDILILKCLSPKFNKVVDYIIKFYNIDFYFIQVGICDIHLKNFIKSKKVNLIYCKNISDNGLKYLKNVENLVIKNDKVTGEFIKSLKNLKSLSINGDNFIGENLKYLQKIEKLDLHYNFNIFDKDILTLDTSQLKYISLNHCHITPISLQCLSNVESISLMNCSHITNDSMKYLSKCKKLYLSGCKINDNGLKYLTLVEDINLSNCRISINGILHMNNLTNLTVNKNTHDVRSILQNLHRTKIRKIHIFDYYLNKEDVEQLKHLYKFGCNGIDTSLLKYLKNVKHIEIVFGNNLLVEDFKCLLNGKTKQISFGIYKNKHELNNYLDGKIKIC